MLLAEVGDGAEVGSVIGRQYSEGDILMETLLDAPGGGHPSTVGVYQHLHHHHRMVGRIASLLTLIRAQDFLQVQMVHHIGDEIGHMICW